MFYLYLNNVNEISKEYMENNVNASLSSYFNVFSFLYIFNRKKNRWKCYTTTFSSILSHITHCYSTSNVK